MATNDSSPKPETASKETFSKGGQENGQEKPPKIQDASK